MRLRALAREALDSAKAARVASIMVTIVVACMCFTALVTVGRSAASVAELTARLDQAGARQLSVVDARAVGFINGRTLASIQALSTVSAANVLGVPFDAYNGRLQAGAPRIPVWPVLGGLQTVGQLARGRWPGKGEALVSTDVVRTLGLTEPVGYLVSGDGTQQFPIVGAFTPSEMYRDLREGAVVLPSEPGQGREIRLTIIDIGAAEATEKAVLAILAPPAAEGVYVESPRSLAETARQLQASMGQQGRSLLLLILGMGSLFVAAVVFADVLLHRRDLGRRRTLGITRFDLVTLVATKTAYAAILGSLVGSASGVVVNVAQNLSTPPIVTVALSLLAVSAAELAALPPAAYAARLDPVSVLRTP